MTNSINNTTMCRKERAEEYGRQWLLKSSYHAQQEYHVRYQNQFLSMLPLTYGSHILECGSGNGDLVYRLEEMHPDINMEYYCLDVSRTLLKHVVSRFESSPLNTTKVLNATVENIPLKSESMDIVFALSVLWYVPDIIASVKEMYRVLKPGGMLCFDIVSLLHPTGMIGRISNSLTTHFRNSYRMNYPIPFRLAAILNKSGMNVNMTGYLPFLPTSLPILGDRLNIYQHLCLLPRIDNLFMLNFCNKVIFSIRKPFKDNLDK